MKFSLQHQIYVFTIISCILFFVLVVSILWSMQVIDIAMQRDKYASKVANHSNTLKQFIVSGNIYDHNYDTDQWLVLERKFNQLLKRAPQLTPKQKNIQNSIVSQNKNVLKLFNTIIENKLKNADDTIKQHLRIRLITQLDAIRADSILLSSIVNKDIQAVIRHQASFILSILALIIIILIYGSFRLTRIVKTSLTEVTSAFKNNHSGRFQHIVLSNQSEEFDSIAEAFNDMNEKLSTTTVSLESMKKIVEERTQALDLLSKTDPLTKVANRRALFERGEAEFSRATRQKSQLALILLDCDHFKAINDRYGHLMGDEILKRLSKVCTEEIRNIDFFARYGGEEFVILLPDSHLNGAIETASRIQRSLAKHCVVFDEHSISVTISIGVAVLSDDHLNFGELLKDGDTAMYQAKTNGRNKIEVMIPKKYK